MLRDSDDRDRSPRPGVHKLELDANRAEILKLLIALFCSPLFWHRTVNDGACAGAGAGAGASAVQAGAMIRGPSRFIMCARHAQCPHGRELFFSLLNGALGEEPSGWLQNTLGSMLPRAMINPERTKVSDTAMHVLLLLLDDGQTEPDDDSAVDEEYADSASDVSEDGEISKCGRDRVSDTVRSPFRVALSQLHELADLDWVLHRIVLRLNMICDSRNSSLAAERHHELLVLLWKLLDGNNSVMDHLLRPRYLNRLLVPILHLMRFERHDHSQAGMIHVCTFLLLRMSSERSFGFALNVPLAKQLRPDMTMRTDDTFGSLLVIAVTSVIVDGNADLDTLYGSLVTILANVSPFCRQLSVLASTQLFDVLQYFAAPSFLSAQASNHKLLSLLLEALSNFIHCQFDSNRELVYVALTRSKLLKRLSTTLPPDIASNALEEAQESQDRRSLGTILHLLDVLTTEVASFCEQQSKPFSQETIVDFLANQRIIGAGLLHKPEPVVMRAYHRSERVDLWFTTFIWGTIFLRAHESADAPMFDSSKITLFQVSHDYDTQ